jgi:hypothetical protein
LAVDTHLPTRTPQPLDRVLRTVEAGPRPFFRAAMVSLAATSVLAVCIALYVRPNRAIQAPQRDIIAAFLAALCVAGVSWLVSLVRPTGARTGLDRNIAPEQRAAIWLALTVWFPTLLIVTYYRAKATFPPSVKWINFGYDDKRWETAAYLLCALAPSALCSGPDAAAGPRRPGAQGRPRSPAKLAVLAGRRSRQREAPQ